MKDLDILNHLIADVAITNTIGDRIWTTWLPAGTIFPAITCNYVTDNPQNDLGGEDDIENEIINVNLWCDDKETLEALYDAVKVRMNGFAIRQNKIDLSDREQGEYRYAVTYSIWG